MNTWTELEPPELPAPTPFGRVIAWVRIFAMVLATLVAVILYASGKLAERVLPFLTYRQAVQSVWASVAAWMAGLKIRRHGTPMKQGGAMVSNHVSWSDIPVLRSSARMNFVSKAEVRKWPGVGPIAAMCDTLVIERRRTAAKAQEAELEARIASGEHLLFFPEGTSSDGRRVLPFKSTLFSVFHIEELRDSVWVQPVSVVYQPRKGSGLPENFYGWWGDMAFGGHVWDVCARSFGGTVDVIFHDPIRAADFPDRKALARYCQDRVEEGLRETLARDG
jgi:1-acyl-sn-glycerol-3-phosphate acyltransferase